MLQLAQRTSAPSATSVSMSTAVCTVMCREPVMRAPRRGCSAPCSARMAMRPGISCSASSISLRPNSARERSATLKRGPWSLVMGFLRSGRRERSDLCGPVCAGRADDIRVRPTHAVVPPQITTHPSYPNWFVGPQGSRRRASARRAASGCGGGHRQGKVGRRLSDRQGVRAGHGRPSAVEVDLEGRRRNSQGDRSLLARLQGDRKEGHQLGRWFAGRGRIGQIGLDDVGSLPLPDVGDVDGERDPSRRTTEADGAAQAEPGVGQPVAEGEQWFDAGGVVVPVSRRRDLRCRWW